MRNVQFSRNFSAFYKFTELVHDLINEGSEEEISQNFLHVASTEDTSPSLLLNIMGHIGL